MISEEVWDRVWPRLERAFERLAAEVNKSVNDLSFQCGRNANEAFPFRAYATFRTKSKVVDLSVDCKLSGGVLLISADIAREEGLVLSELPSRAVPLDTNEAQLSREIDEIIAEIEGFASQQADLVCKELRSQ